MTLVSLAIVLIALVGHVAGELVLKKAMDASNAAGFRPENSWRRLAPASCS